MVKSSLLTFAANNFVQRIWLRFQNKLVDQKKKASQKKSNLFYFEREKNDLFCNHITKLREEKELKKSNVCSSAGISARQGVPDKLIL